MIELDLKDQEEESRKTARNVQGWKASLASP